jgi:hypothetical protein
MTIVSTASTALVAEFAGGASSDVDMMIGIGLVKDSDAVFFEYLGDEAEPSALMLPSGKALTRMPNVMLSGIDVAEDVGEFNSTKLNLFLQTSAGRSIMVTSGLTTIWSQCVITALMGMLGNEDLTAPFTLDTWKGTSKMRPCFAAVRVGQVKMTDNDMYQQLADARADKDKEKTMTIMRDAVSILKHALTGGDTEEVNITVAPQTEDADLPF